MNVLDKRRMFMEALHVQGRSLFQKVLVTFIISLLIATVGLYVGQYVPTAFMLPLAVVEIGMLIAAFWLRKKKMVGYAFVYVFTFISGITLYPTISYYLSQTGANIVLTAFGISAGTFIVFGFIGAKTKKDLSFLGSFLLVAVLALIVGSIIAMFSPMTSTGVLIFSMIGAVVFSLYILYDFNQMKQHGISEEAVPLLALNLYLDFINLFLYVLRILGVLNSDD